jgi:hypothetical protein
MFFGADGITTDEAKFEAAVRRFLGSPSARVPVTGTDVLRTGNSVRRLRVGYTAMLLAIGYVAAP